MDRAKLVRAHFAAYSDLTWARELEPKFRAQGVTGAELERFRAAWNRHTERRDWEWWQEQTAKQSNAVLEKEIRECREAIASLALTREETNEERAGRSQPPNRTREQLVLETFELSREIGYQHFLAKNFNRDDPALTRLNPEVRTAFLRNWWDAARDQMYQEYRQQVAGLGVRELLDWREGYIDMLDAMGITQWRQAKSTDERNNPEAEQDRDQGREM
jgi:hypothetical protein